MQSDYDNILSPDFNEPFQYFDSSPPSTSRTTPPIYADDPWSTTLESAFDFHSSSYVNGRDMQQNAYFNGDTDEQKLALFGTELTSSNALLDVDIPDIYIDIYSKSDPHDEKIAIQSLEIILNQLSGLSLINRQKVMSLITPPEADFITRNEFNTYLALIACGQKNMEISLETVYTHRSDLPKPNFKNLDTFNIRDILKRDQSIVDSNPKKPSYNLEQDTNKNNTKKNHAKKSISDMNSTSSITTTVSQNQEGVTQQQLHLTQNRTDQDAISQWFRDLDHITISRTSEKEGFLFKHINYEVESEKLGSKVLRRFSDFYWLWEILLKRYPFRILPNLPPKKVGGRNDMFEERRRRGLVRFINAVIWHPILGKDEVVVAFLRHPSEINSWKRTNSPSLDEEFVRKSHNITYLERHIPMDLDDRINRMKKRLSVSIQQYEHMCLIMHQMNRLKKALGTDYMRYSVTLNSVSELDKHCLVPGCQGCPQLVDGCGYISKSLYQAGAMLNKQAAATGDGILEGLKRQRDLLESFKELLERKDKMSPVHSETLARQAARYKEGKVLPSVAHDDYSISAQPQSELSTDNNNSAGLSIAQQREIYIKHCILEELSFLHKQQASLSSMYNYFVHDEVRYAKQWSEHWKQLEVLTSKMPIAPQDFL